MNKSLLDYTIDYSIIQTIDKNILYEKKIIPLRLDKVFLLIATSKKYDTDEFVKIFNQPIKFVYVDISSIEFELKYLDTKLKLYELSYNALKIENINSENSFIMQFIDTILEFCIDLNGSDIHCECLQDSFIFRFRIDGKLIQFFRFDISLYSMVSSIIKYFGNLDIAQKRLPLNGRFSRYIKKHEYDIRISTMPTIYGESIVLRLLNNNNIKKDLSCIGFDDTILKVIRHNISLTQGLLLVTGPTGSGKTTTLYSILNDLDKTKKKIITIEDPVEYKLDGIIQININEDIDLNYHLVLKNILRQDPDILLIGEIRDKEALKIAIQASLTGHLVIATLHTNSALETITRLLDLEIEPYLLASTLKMVLSQRLVRILCNSCKQKLNNQYHSVGCQECNFTGYKNRHILSEILEIDKTLANLISDNKPSNLLLEYAIKQGFIPIKQHSVKLIKDGLTTKEECDSIL